MADNVKLGSKQTIVKFQPRNEIEKRQVETPKQAAASQWGVKAAQQESFKWYADWNFDAKRNEILPTGMQFNAHNTRYEYPAQSGEPAMALQLSVPEHSELERAGTVNVNFQRGSALVWVPRPEQASEAPIHIHFDQPVSQVGTYLTGSRGVVDPTLALTAKMTVKTQSGQVTRLAANGNSGGMLPNWENPQAPFVGAKAVGSDKITDVYFDVVPAKAGEAPVDHIAMSELYLNR